MKAVNVWIKNCKNIYVFNNKDEFKTIDHHTNDRKSTNTTAQLVKKIYLCVICLFFILTLNHCEISSPPEDTPPETDPSEKTPRTDTPSKDDLFAKPALPPLRKSKNDLDKVRLRKPPFPKKLTFQQIQSMPAEEINDIGKKGDFPFSDVSNWTLSALSVEQLATIFQILHSYDELYRIIPLQLQNLPNSHVQVIKHHLKNLPLEHTQIWTPEQLAGVEISWLNSQHIRSLSFEHLSVMVLDLNIDEILPFISFELFTKAVQNSLFRSLTCSQIQPLTEEQIIQYGIILFTPDQISCLLPHHISAIPMDGIVYIKPLQLAAMSDEQLTAISIEKSHQFLDDHLRELSLSQLLLFKDNPKIKSIIDFITNESALFETATAESISNQEYYIQFLPPNSFNNVSEEQALSFSDDLLTNLTSKRIVEMPYYVQMLNHRPHLTESVTTETIQVLPLKEIPHLTQDVLIRLTDKQVGSFTPAQLLSMTSKQIKDILSSRFTLHTLSLEKTIAVLETVRQSEQAQNITNVIKGVQSKHCEQTHSNNELLKLKCTQKWNNFFNFIESSQEEKRKKCRQYQVQHNRIFKDVDGMEFNLEWCLRGFYSSVH